MAMSETESLFSFFSFCRFFLIVCACSQRLRAEAAQVESMVRSGPRRIISYACYPITLQHAMHPNPRAAVFLPTNQLMSVFEVRELEAASEQPMESEDLGAVPALLFNARDRRAGLSSGARGVRSTSVSCLMRICANF